MKAIAIDDEPIALEVIKAHATKVPFLELVATFTNAFEALSFLQREPVDLLFLDIKMPDISGLEFYQSLSRKPLLIFTTAYTDYATDSYELDAVDYLLKPFSLPRFIKACNKAQELYNFRNAENGVAEPEHIFVKTGYEQVKIPFGDILYLEATGNYVSYVLADKKILSRSTFSEAAQQLPAGRFIRVHRSFVVAKDKIDKAERHQVTIQGHEVPVSEGYRKDMVEALGG